MKRCHARSNSTSVFSYVEDLLATLPLIQSFSISASITRQYVAIGPSIIQAVFEARAFLS